MKDKSYCISLNLSWYKFNHSVMLHGNCNSHGNHWKIRYIIYKKRLRAFLVAQRVKHLPAMLETWVRSLGQEDPLEKETATHSILLPGKFHG